MRWLTPRERLFRARIEMVVLFLAEGEPLKLGVLSQKMDVHPSYLCRFLRDLADVGLLNRPGQGKYTLSIPSGEFDWRWLELPFLNHSPNVIAYHRLTGYLEFRWCESMDSHDPSWPWGDYIDRAAKRWSPASLEKRSKWNSLKNRLLRAYRRVVFRVKRL